MEPIRKGLKGRKWIVAFLIYIGLIAICCIAVYAVPSVKGILERTYIAEYGTVDVKDEVSAFIVRDETVYAAEYTGNLNRLAKEGTLVKTGAKVAELTEEEEESLPGILGETPDNSEKDEEKADSKAGSGSSEDKKKESEKQEKQEEPASPSESATRPSRYTGIMEDIGDAAVVTGNGIVKEAGYVCYYVDGAEAALSTKSFEGLQEKDFKRLTGKNAVETPKKRFETGYPLFKIVSNSKWYLIYYLSNEDAAKYAEGDTVELEINEEPVTVTVSRIESGTRNSKITLVCKVFFDGFLETRSLDTKVTVASAQGLMLEDASIVDAPDGKRGVFVKNKLGEHVFTPVRTKADDGVKCVVYSDIYVDDEGNFVETIGTYDEIIASPSEEDIASLKNKGSSDKKE